MSLITRKKKIEATCDENTDFDELLGLANQGDINAAYFLGMKYFDCVDKESWKEAHKWFVFAADNGHAGAMCRIGNMYSLGKYVEQSSEKAALWYLKAAHRGDPCAQSNLAFMYMRGKGVEQSSAKGVKWLTKAAIQGDVDSQISLADWYMNGVGVRQSDSEAAKWYLKAAEQGNSNAQLTIGDMYADGVGVRQSDSEAIKWYLKAAEQGDPFALDCLKIMGVDTSNLVLQSATEGPAVSNDSSNDLSDNKKIQATYDNLDIQKLIELANQGDLDAAYSLGMKYYFDSSEESVKETLKWIVLAANKGHAGAQGILGNMYALGKGVEKSVTKAVEWYQKGALQGDPCAQYNLAFMYLRGEGVAQSDEKAVDLVTKAANSGYDAAQFKLGEWYSDWHYDSEAAKWYLKAAEQGNADAFYVLGGIYENGEGVLQSNAEAIKWYRKAAEYGDPIAEECLKRLGADESAVLNSSSNYTSDTKTKIHHQDQIFEQLKPLLEENPNIIFENPKKFLSALKDLQLPQKEYDVFNTLISAEPKTVSLLLINSSDSNFEKNCRKLAEDYFYSPDKVMELMGKLRSAIKSFNL